MLLASTLTEIHGILAKHGYALVICSRPRLQRRPLISHCSNVWHARVEVSASSGDYVSTLI